MKWIGTRFAIAATLSWMLVASAQGQESGRVTIIYDAFGASSKLVKDWGYAALVEYGGKRILFDTGNNAKIFENNVKELGIDLKRLDAVVVSHRHGDHTSGLTYVLTVNPEVKIFVPQESAFFNGPIPAGFFRSDPTVPPELRYYDGRPPQRALTGSAWEGARFETVTKPIEIFPGVIVFTTQSQKPGTIEMNEASLAIRTPKGLAVMVGCSHPGVDKVLAEAAKIDPRVYLVAGGFHLVLAPEEEVRRVAVVLDDSFKVQRVAPGHCTSELGFAVFMDRFKDRFDKAGVGTFISLP